MHDSFLLNKLAAALQRICKENRLRNIKELEIEVSADSHITGEDLKEHLIEIIPYLVGRETDIRIRKTALEKQNAVIYMLKGDSLEA